MKLAVWEALLAQYVDSIEWVLQVLSMHQFSCNFIVVVVGSIGVVMFAFLLTDWPVLICRV